MTDAAGVLDRKRGFFFPDSYDDMTFDKLVYSQVWHCMIVGSIDDSLPGIQRVMDNMGNYHEIVRDDNQKGFMNSVRMLYFLVKNKMTATQKANILDFDQDYTFEKAIQNFNILMDYVHNDGLFGRNALAIMVDWRVKK